MWITGGLVFRMAAAAAQMIEADVGHNAVNPGVEGAIKAEARQVAINFQECFLVDVLGVFGAAQNVEREAQNLAVIALDENFEGGAVAGLRALDEDAVFGAGRRFAHAAQGASAGAPSVLIPCESAIASDDIAKGTSARPISCRAQPGLLLL